MTPPKKKETLAVLCVFSLVLSAREVTPPPCFQRMPRILRFTMGMTTTSDVTEVGKREARLHELSCFKAPFDFVIPPQTGLLITTSDDDEDNFLAFLIGNTDRMESVYITEGTSLPDVFDEVDAMYSRCPLSVYSQLKTEDNQRGDENWLIDFYFSDNFMAPLMQDDCHDMEDCCFDDPVYEFFERPRQTFKYGPYKYVKM
jgi:hypothetical protein